MYEANASHLAQLLKKNDTIELWHRWLEHLNLKNIHVIQSFDSDMNLGQILCPKSSLICEACIEGKQHRVAFPKDGKINN